MKHLSLSLFGSRFLGTEEHAGFLYIRSTLQSLQGLPLPNQPYLFGLLVHRAEVAWAKAFPLRLMLRLGAEYRCKQGPNAERCLCSATGFLLSHTLCFLFPVYPCPLYSVRLRKPLFREIGHTIMRLLVVSMLFPVIKRCSNSHDWCWQAPSMLFQDFRNYRYSLPMVPGLTVDLEAQRTCIKIPTTGYNEVRRSLFFPHRVNVYVFFINHHPFFSDHLSHVSWWRLWISPMSMCWPSGRASMRQQTLTSSVCKEKTASTRPRPSASTISHAKVGHNRIQWGTSAWQLRGGGESWLTDTINYKLNKNTFKGPVWRI